MVIVRTRNEITDFLMILAWASRFNIKNEIDVLFEMKLILPINDFVEHKMCFYGNFSVTSISDTI